MGKDHLNKGQNPFNNFILIIILLMRIKIFYVILQKRHKFKMDQIKKE